MESPSTRDGSMDLAEVYRLIYNGPLEHVRGAIVTADEESGFQLLFKDNKEHAEFTTYELGIRYMSSIDDNKDKALDVKSYPVIQDRGQILLNGPIEASIGVGSGFSTSFYLFGSVKESISTPNPIDYPECVSVPLETTLESDNSTPHLITMLYAIFMNAVEAHVKLKFTKVKSDFSFYGVITSRTSAITHPVYSSILFFKNKDEKIQIGSGNDEKDITLLRPIVGVPLGSKLFLLLGLYSDDNKMVEERLVFDVKNIKHDSKDYHVVDCGKCKIKVEIVWKCQRKGS